MPGPAAQQPNPTRITLLEHDLLGIAPRADDPAAVVLALRTAGACFEHQAVADVDTPRPDTGRCATCGRLLTLTAEGGWSTLQEGGETVAGRRDLTTYDYRKKRARFLAESDICHLCGHAGADVVDHDRPVSRGADPRDMDNWRPAHGVNRCPTCGRNCNGEKGAAVRAPGLRTSRDWYTEGSDHA